MSKELIVDTKLEELMKSYTEDYFYAKESAALDKKLDGKKACNPKFDFQFDDFSTFKIYVKNKRICSPVLEFCKPGILSLITFFYALEQGYEEIYLDEYDYFDAYTRFTAKSSKDSKYAKIYIEDLFGDRITNNIIINKKKCIKDFKKVMQETYSDENLQKIGPEILRPNFKGKLEVLDDSVDIAERCIGEWNQIRGMVWLFPAPQKELTLKDFLNDESYEVYLKLKELYKK